MDDFAPGEYAQIDTIQYLEPTHFYGQDKGKNEAESGGGGISGGGGNPGGSNLLDMFGDAPSSAPAQQIQPQSQP